ncbi:DNA replication licensing factor MCM4 [Nematocida displodere]|uniref:DNA replication licensing factor MCM4 n=1 Tax=Nematocida displodere TaxID=1805483 RepID=A0A177ECT1_9MICR|nr:DNA replication licensing factor MCM4 [Nematocida displodere]
MVERDGESSMHSQNSLAFSFEDASQLNVSLGQNHASYHTDTHEADELGSEIHKGSICTLENVRVVWGTTINIQETIELFKDFIRTYTTEETAYHESRKLYIEKIDEIHEVESPVLRIDCSHMNKEKYQKLLKEIELYPVEILPLLEIGIMDLYLEKYPQAQTSIQILLVNIGKKREIKGLAPIDIDTTVEIQGMVTKTSGIIPDILTATYVCTKCSHTLKAEVVRDVIAEPVDCACGEKFSMEMESTLCKFQDKQIIKVQEMPGSTKDGLVPSTITIIAENTGVDAFIPGDRVKISGIYRAVPIKLNYIHRTIKSSFKTYIEMISFAKISHTEEPVEDAFVVLEQIEQLRVQPDIYEMLAESLAPSIYGMLDVKKGLLLQLFGGVTKTLNGARFRGDINVLLAGDPGVAKSQLLLGVHRLTDRGVYTCGKGSSAVGLTASVSRDSDSGQHILESGALVISDGGICCIDEFDKMGEQTRSVLHEAMEQQTVSVAKAGIITTLNARCSILAACNPINSSYNPKKNIVENLDIPPTLLSRFDIVCLLLDKIETKRDRQISDHIIRLYTGDAETAIPPIERSILKQYIKEGRRIIPKLTQDASERVSRGYQELRQLGHGKSVTATTRQLESIIRLSEAHARMRLAQTVEVQDVEEAIRLIKDSLHIYAIDPVTGRIDMELIHTGKTTASLQMEETLKEEILKLLGKGTTIPILLERLTQNTRLTEKGLRFALTELQEEGKLILDGVSVTPN